MKKHETNKRNNNTDMQKQNKKTNKIDTPHTMDTNINPCS